MTPDILYDQMIGVGAARRLVFSYGGNPGVGSLHRFRDAIENGWPRAVEIEEHSHAGMANRYAAGRVGAAVRGHARLRRHRPGRPHERRADHLPVHRRAADRRPGARSRRRRSSTPRRPTATATSSCGASRACRRRRCSPRKRSLVTVERIVDELEPRPGGVVIPGWVIDAVAEAPARLAALLQSRDHRARQRLLPLLGRAQPRPRRVRRVDGASTSCERR